MNNNSHPVEYEPDRVAFGIALRAELADRGVKPGELAEQIGVLPARVSDWLQGRVFPDRYRYAIENTLGLPRGWCLIKAGLVDLPMAFLDYLEVEFTPAERRAIRAFVETLRDTR